MKIKGKLKTGFSILLAALMISSLAACGNNETPTASDPIPQSSEQNLSTPSDTNTNVPDSPPQVESNILIAYFSRWGNTEYPDNVDASTSASHLIQTVTPYTTDFDELRDVNHNEMANNTLPELKESDLDISKYNTVFVGYPVWATDVPQAVVSFLNQYHLSGKTVIPFCTHDGYGAGSSYGTISTESKAAQTLDGLAIEAKDVPGAKDTVADWLKSIGISKQENNPSQSGETAIKITIGDTVLDGILYDTPLAQEIKAQLPLTISMVGYGGREYYGGVDFYPEHLEGGKKTFDNGDITYCEAHHNMAIFYAQTDNPNLSVDVIPIGKVTSDLAVFDTLDSREDITFSLAE